MLFLNGLPRFYHPTFQFSRFGGVTDDKYLLVIEASDPKFDLGEVRQVLTDVGARYTEVVEA
jgi:hypothetical protein